MTGQPPGPGVSVVIKGAVGGTVTDAIPQTQLDAETNKGVLVQNPGYN